MTPAYRGALLDLWGTLAPENSRATREAHLTELARILGVDPVVFLRDWAETLDARCLGTLGSLEETIRTVAGRQGTRPSREEIRNAAEARLAYTKMTVEAGGVLLPALDELRAAGMHLALVSNCTAEIPRVWASLPLSRRFDATVFSCDTGHCKPDPRMYRLGLERLDLRAEECVFVGDNGFPGELAGAETLGIRAFQFLFPREGPTPEPEWASGATWDGPRLGDLRELTTLDRRRAVAP